MPDLLRAWCEWVFDRENWQDRDQNGHDSRGIFEYLPKIEAVLGRFLTICSRKTVSHQAPSRIVSRKSPLGEGIRARFARARDASFQTAVLATVLCGVESQSTAAREFGAYPIRSVESPMGGGRRPTVEAIP